MEKKKETYIHKAIDTYAKGTYSEDVVKAVARWLNDNGIWEWNCVASKTADRNTREHILNLNTIHTQNLKIIIQMKI